MFFVLSRAWDKSPFTELKTYHLCGSVVGHRSAESEGLRFHSSWGLRIFFFVPRSQQNEKHLSLFLNRAQNLPSLLFLIIIFSNRTRMSQKTKFSYQDPNRPEKDNFMGFVNTGKLIVGSSLSLFFPYLSLFAFLFVFFRSFFVRLFDLCCRFRFGFFLLFFISLIPFSFLFNCSLFCFPMFFREQGFKE